MYIDIYRGFSYDFDENGEKQLLDALGEVFDENIVFFDVGANVGNWSFHAINAFKNYEGHLFELSEVTYENLYNRYSHNLSIRLNNLALSDISEETIYRDFGENDGGNTLLLEASYHDKASNLKKVTCVKGDNYCQKAGILRIHLLKIDTEGTEFAVLRGFEEMLSHHKIDVIQFEYGYTHADAYTLMKDFYRLFESHGYLVGQLRKDGVRFKEFSYPDNDFKSGPNYVACLPELKAEIASFKKH